MFCIDGFVTLPIMVSLLAAMRSVLSLAGIRSGRRLVGGGVTATRFSLSDRDKRRDISVKW